MILWRQYINLITKKRDNFGVGSIIIQKLFDIIYGRSLITDSDDVTQFEFMSIHVCSCFPLDTFGTIKLTSSSHKIVTIKQALSIITITTEEQISIRILRVKLTIKLVFLSFGFTAKILKSLQCTKFNNQISQKISVCSIREQFFHLSSIWLFENPSSIFFCFHGKRVWGELWDV